MTIVKKMCVSPPTFHDGHLADKHQPFWQDLSPVTAVVAAIFQLTVNYWHIENLPPQRMSPEAGRL
jgi:hypothetical protein